MRSNREKKHIRKPDERIERKIEWEVERKLSKRERGRVVRIDKKVEW